MTPAIWTRRQSASHSGKLLDTCSECTAPIIPSEAGKQDRTQHIIQKIRISLQKRRFHQTNHSDKLDFAPTLLACTEFAESTGQSAAGIYRNLGLDCVIN